MKALLTTAFLVILATPASSQSFSDFMNTPLSNDAGNLTINSNGTVRGTINGQDTRLKWTSENGKFCREGTVGSNQLPKKCQTVRINGNQITFVDPDGSVSSRWTSGN